MYGIEVWYWDASERSRDLLSAAQHKGSRIIAATLHGTREEDSLLEANLLPLKMTTLVRSMKFMLMCESRGGCLRRSAEEVYHSKHPVRALHSRIMRSYPHLRIEPREHPLETSTLRHSCRPIFHTQIKPVCADDPDDVKREASESGLHGILHGGGRSHRGECTTNCGLMDPCPSVRSPEQGNSHAVTERNA
ncbi:hypothetical protein DPX39_060037300 [Trypanosoma brucei equiperdum]|uniref:Uncharacterized protein n=1 Tax=Trypanosoma brucei equiperdum TaxID=630700 RepID=A0A3L6LBY8_9TRYP|nr:hypothetical protein DPX39_060037300 [Trypanosoma brucei equiperdum]